jgi:hypothetical protein
VNICWRFKEYFTFRVRLPQNTHFRVKGFTWSWRWRQCGPSNQRYICIILTSHKPWIFKTRVQIFYSYKTCARTNTALRSKRLLNGHMPKHGLGGWCWASQCSNGRTSKGTCDTRYWNVTFLLLLLLCRVLVEIKCINVRRNTTEFQIVDEINYMFRPFSVWAIIRLRLEYRRKLLYYNVDIKHGDRDLVLQCSSLNLMMAHPEKGRNM